MPDVPLAPDRFHDAVGCCIYCRSDGGGKQLTKEHILAASLGGRDFIRKASCSACQDATKAIEGYIAGKLMGQFRNARGVYTRRPKERPTKLPLRLRVGDELKAIEAPVEDHPAPLVLPMLPWPTFLTGDTRPPRVPLSTWHRQIDAEKLGEPESKKWRHRVEIDLLMFARFLAKVAHCDAVGDFGIDDFEPYLVPLILGQDGRAHRFTGSIPGMHLPGDRQAHLRSHRLFQRGHETLVIHRLRLFADTGGPKVENGNGTPHFITVTGRLRDPLKWAARGWNIHGTLEGLADDLLRVRG